jgi:hypothetical protein
MQNGNVILLLLPPFLRLLPKTIPLKKIETLTLKKKELGFRDLMVKIQIREEFESGVKEEMVG